MKQIPIKELLNFSLINIDKPTGPTSFQISQYVKEKLNLVKTSHMGTLDPMVTGVLPITLGRACKLSNYFMGSDKEYVGVMQLHTNIALTSIRREADKFRGKIKQLPPVRSAVKRAVRERTIKYIKFIEKKNKDVLFDVEVQAGTYIRKLIHEIGEKIGGAHMLELRRTRAGIFKEDTALTLYDFDRIIQDEEALRKILIPAEIAIKKVLPHYQINKTNLDKLLTGKPLTMEDLHEIPKDEVFSAFIQERFIGIYKLSDDHGVIAKPEFVYN